MRALALALLVAGACGSSARPVAPLPPPGDLGVDVANLTAQLPPYIASVGGGQDARKLSGYVLVAQHDQPIFSQGYGFADRAKQQVPGPDTSFRIGSVTKQFTAAAILKLEQDGKLAVTDTVGKHLPEFPGPGKAVTIHQLLTHTGGIPSYTDDPAVMVRKHERFTTKQLLETFWAKDLDFAPGTAFAYSNSGYAILGAIIERASGKSYGEYLTEALFRPAKLTRTVVGDAVGAADRAEGYQVTGSQVEPADPIDMSVPFAAGAIRSTANDLVRWHRALQGDTILNATQRAKLYRAERDNYGYGWVSQELRGRATVWHNGGIDGFSTMYWRVPDADLVVVAWSNVFGVQADPIARAAVDVALGGTADPVKPVKVLPVDAKIVARVSGHYELTDDARAKLEALKVRKSMIDSVVVIEISVGERGLMLKPIGQSAVEVLAQEDGTFFDADHGVRIVFDLAGDGPVRGFMLVQGGVELGYKR